MSDTQTISSNDSSRFHEGLASLSQPLSHLGELVLDNTMKDQIKGAIALIFDQQWPWNRIKERYRLINRILYNIF